MVILNFRKLKEKDENILPTEISTKKTIRNADDNIDAENTENIHPAEKYLIFYINDTYLKSNDSIINLYTLLYE